jgi:hypothetical protein
VSEAPIGSLKKLKQISNFVHFNTIAKQQFISRWQPLAHICHPDPSRRLRVTT